jgi:PBP1b-binding outer membrane lipoprotein LpoB
MLRVISAIALALFLAACSLVGSGPPVSVVEQAIALQLNQTQQELSQQLRISSQASKITVSHIKVKAQAPFQIEGLQAYQVKGICDFTVKLPKRSITQRKASFEVNLQQQKEGKTWRLAFLKMDDEGETFWVTEQIP